MNQVNLIGNMTRDVDLRYTPAGKAIAQIGLAHSEKFKTATGEDKEVVLFVDVDVWGRTAEVIERHCQKGSKLAVSGRLTLDAWLDKETQKKRTRIKITASRVDILTWLKSESGQPAETVPENAPEDEDDIRF